MIKANSKELDKVENLYLEMIEDGIKPNVYIYNTMIDAYAKNEELEKAIEMFASMKRDGVKPDVMYYITVQFSIKVYYPYLQECRNAGRSKRFHSCVHYRSLRDSLT
jgi:pentatricopeptide repeat protein